MNVISLPKKCIDEISMDNLFNMLLDLEEKEEPETKSILLLLVGFVSLMVVNILSYVKKVKPCLAKRERDWRSASVAPGFKLVSVETKGEDPASRGRVPSAPLIMNTGPQTERTLGVGHIPLSNAFTLCYTGRLPCESQDYDVRSGVKTVNQIWEKMKK